MEDQEIGAGPPLAAEEEMEASLEAAPTAAAAPYSFEPPYSSEMSAKMKKFYYGRGKSPYDFVPTSSGDLETKAGATYRKRAKPLPAETLLLKKFEPITQEERDALEDSRRKRIAEIQGQFQGAMEGLQTAYKEYKLNGAITPYLNANERVKDLDAQLTAALNMERSIVSLRNLPVKLVQFDQPYEERNIFYDFDAFGSRLFRIARYPFPQHVEFGKYIEVVGTEEDGESDSAAAESTPGSEELQSYRKKLADGRTARIFFESSDPNNGFLSPLALATFTLRGTEYASPYQAYEYLRAVELESPELAQKILGTRSSRTVRLATQVLQGNPSDSRKLWLDILTAAFQQNPLLQKQLLETGTDALVYADPRKGPSGIGLAEKDAASLNPATWKGENYVGLALETIRTQLREETLGEARSEEATVKAITEDEQKKAKVGAIISSRRGTRY